MNGAVTEAAPCPPDVPPTPAQGSGLLQRVDGTAAAQMDPVGWHYIQVLAERTRTQTGPAQALLQAKLNKALAQMQARLPTPPNTSTPPPSRSPSPLSALLQHMAAPSAEHPLSTSSHGRMDKPRIVQFRQQLHRISVQKQVTQAIAQAPQNAGPINSHMLVLRSLGLMRDISPDYLNRFMGYVDTLLVLEAAGQSKALTKKAAAPPKRPSP